MYHAGEVIINLLCLRTRICHIQPMKCHNSAQDAMLLSLYHKPSHSAKHWGVLLFWGECYAHSTSDLWLPFGKSPFGLLIRLHIWWRSAVINNSMGTAITRVVKFLLKLRLIAINEDVPDVKFCKWLSVTTERVMKKHWEHISKLKGKKHHEGLPLDLNGSTWCHITISALKKLTEVLNEISSEDNSDFTKTIAGFTLSWCGLRLQFTQEVKSGGMGAWQNLWVSDLVCAKGKQRERGLGGMNKYAWHFWVQWSHSIHTTQLVPVLSFTHLRVTSLIIILKPQWSWPTT